MQDSSRFTWHPLAPLLKQHLTYLATPVCAGDPNSQILICEMIESLVAAIATADGPDTNAASRKIRDQLLFEINRNIGSSQYALGDAARTLGLAPRTIQIHLAALGTRFSVILRDRRLETAFAALNTKDRRQSIDTVAFETGFESTAAFYRAFKKKYHCTPAETHRHAKLSS